VAFRRLSPDLFFRVRNSLERNGYCILGVEEMQRLLSSITGNRLSKTRFVQQFAKACGAVVETTPRLTSARFVKAREKRERL
jgi:hypothetical protein